MPAASQACGLEAFIYILPAALDAGRQAHGVDPKKMGAAAPRLIMTDTVPATRAQHRAAGSMTESSRRIGRHNPSFRRSRQIWLR